MRFLYIQVLKRGWSVAETPYPKKVLHLPEILSQQEVARLIDATGTPFQRILLMTLYATGARRAEVARLWCKDNDLAVYIAQRVESGTVWVNEPMHLAAEVPFAGRKQSGVGAEGGIEGLLEYTVPQTIWTKKVS